MPQDQKPKQKQKYHGITHEVPSEKLPEWKKAKCSQNIHAFDEVWSIESHHLSCDACGLVVQIAKIDTQYVEKTA